MILINLIFFAKITNNLKMSLRYFNKSEKTVKLFIFKKNLNYICTLIFNLKM